MWPKRKIQLVASSAASGIDGVRALLSGVQLKFCEVEPIAEDLCESSSERWMEMPFTDMTKSGQWDPVTELVYWPWPDGLEEDLWKKKALSQGINQQPIQALIHNILQDESVLWISEPTVLIEGRPLLGHILDMAGFEPTIVWQKDGKWHCVQKQGSYWLISESWLDVLVDKSTLGRKAELGSNEQTTWVVRETQVDFYHSSEGRGYLGYLPRWPEPIEEPRAYHIIAKCFDMGVSWFDIKLALGSLWKNQRRVDNMRWEINDFGWNDGKGGEKISIAPIEHLEDWWAR